MQQINSLVACTVKSTLKQINLDSKQIPDLQLNPQQIKIFLENVDVPYEFYVQPSILQSFAQQYFDMYGINQEQTLENVQIWVQSNNIYQLSYAYNWAKNINCYDNYQLQLDINPKRDKLEILIILNIAMKLKITFPQMQLINLNLDDLETYYLVCQIAYEKIQQVNDFTKVEQLIEKLYQSINKSVQQLFFIQILFVALEKFQKQYTKILEIIKNTDILKKQWSPFENPQYEQKYPYLEDRQSLFIYQSNEEVYNQVVDALSSQWKQQINQQIQQGKINITTVTNFYDEDILQTTTTNFEQSVCFDQTQELGGAKREKKKKITSGPGAGPNSLIKSTITRPTIQFTNEMSMLFKSQTQNSSNQTLNDEKITEKKVLDENPPTSNEGSAPSIGGVPPPLPPNKAPPPPPNKAPPLPPGQQAPAIQKPKYPKFNLEVFSEKLTQNTIWDLKEDLKLKINEDLSQFQLVSKQQQQVVAPGGVAVGAPGGVAGGAPGGVPVGAPAAQQIGAKIKHPSSIEDPDTIKNIELWFRQLIPYKDESFEYIDNLEFLDKVPKENYKHRDFLQIFVMAFKKISDNDIKKIYNKKKEVEDYNKKNEQEENDKGLQPNTLPRAEIAKNDAYILEFYERNYHKGVDLEFFEQEFRESKAKNDQFVPKFSGMLEDLKKNKELQIYFHFLREYGKILGGVKPNEGLKFQKICNFDYKSSDKSADLVKMIVKEMIEMGYTFKNDDQTFLNIQFLADEQNDISEIKKIKKDFEMFVPELEENLQHLVKEGKASQQFIERAKHYYGQYKNYDISLDTIYEYVEKQYQDIKQYFGDDRKSILPIQFFKEINQIMTHLRIQSVMIAQEKRKALFERKKIK